jgi:UDP-sugar pyrophosphorylase
MLLDQGQAHVLAFWPVKGKDDDQKRRLMRQLSKLDSTYPGGVSAYLTNAKTLLAQSSAGDNVFEGYTPAIPEGIVLSVLSGTGRLEYFEDLGLEAARDAAFVLVAGGLGERLGYSGIKVCSIDRVYLYDMPVCCLGTVYDHNIIINKASKPLMFNTCMVLMPYPDEYAQQVKVFCI